MSQVIRSDDLFLIIRDAQARLQRLEAALSQAGSGGSPSGAAGGDLTGTYPNPTIITSVALGGNPTTTTQATTDNSTRIATTAFVKNLLGGYATTISGAAGGDLTGTYPNPQVARLTEPSIEIDEGTVLAWDGTLQATTYTRVEVWGTGTSFNDSFSSNTLSSYTLLNSSNWGANTPATWHSGSPAYISSDSGGTPGGFSAYYKNDAYFSSADAEIIIKGQPAGVNNYHLEAVMYDPISGWYLHGGYTYYLFSGNDLATITTRTETGIQDHLQEGSYPIGVSTDSDGNLWVKLNKAGNLVTVSLHAGNPETTASYAGTSYTLTATSASYLGAGRTLRPGFLLGGGNPRLYGLAEGDSATFELLGAVTSPADGRVERAIMQADGTTELLPEAGSITASMLATNSVTSTKISASSVGLSHLTASGTTNASTYLRGDNTWSLLPAGSGGTSRLSRAIVSRRATSTTVSNNNGVNVIWDTVLSNPDSLWASTNPTRFTADAPGLFQLSGTIFWNGTSNLRETIINHYNSSGVLQREVIADTTVGVGNAGSFNGVFDMTTSDYLSVFAWQNSGSGITFGASNDRTAAVFIKLSST